MIKNKFLKTMAAIAIAAGMANAQVWDGTANTAWYNASQSEFVIRRQNSWQAWRSW